jgi:predicted dehydrogenase
VFNGSPTLASLSGYFSMAVARALVTVGLMRRFDPGYLAMKEVLADLIAKAKGVASHNDVYDLEPSHTPQNPRVRRIKKPHVLHPVFWDFAKSPKLLSVLTRLLGPNVRLHGSKLNTKDPKYGSPVEWHQDWAFYPHTNDDLLAVGVMLDDMELENGPVMVAGTHKASSVITPRPFLRRDGPGRGAAGLQQNGTDGKRARPVPSHSARARFRAEHSKPRQLCCTKPAQQTPGRW